MQIQSDGLEKKANEKTPCDGSAARAWNQIRDYNSDIHNSIKELERLRIELRELSGPYCSDLRTQCPAEDSFFRGLFALVFNYCICQKKRCSAIHDHYSARSKTQGVEQKAF
jgi:hypothetical protein